MSFGWNATNRLGWMITFWIMIHWVHVKLTNKNEGKKKKKKESHFEIAQEHTNLDSLVILLSFVHMCASNFLTTVFENGISSSNWQGVECVVMVQCCVGAWIVKIVGEFWLHDLPAVWVKLINFFPIEHNSATNN